MTRKVIVGYGEPAQFECKAEGHPLETEDVFWEREGYDFVSRANMANGIQDLSKRKSPHQVSILLTIPNTTENDEGTFWCVARNELGMESKEPVLLSLKRKK